MIYNFGYYTYLYATPKMDPFILTGQQSAGVLLGSSTSILPLGMGEECSHTWAS